MGEEWRRGWHPEIIPASTTAEPVLVIGGGPAGLEAARALVQRGVSVTLAERGNEWGGRVSREARLPGLAAWGRVRDWRMGQLLLSPDAQLFLNSPLTANDILSYSIPHVVLATGARWRVDGVGRAIRAPLHDLAAGPLISPDDLIDRGATGVGVLGPVVIYDDDRCYLASLLAELLLANGHAVTLVTPSPIVAAWTVNTLEQQRIQTRLLMLGATILPLHRIAARSAETLTLACIYTDRRHEIACAILVPVTMRLPVEGLWLDLKEREAEWADAGIISVTRIGDALAPGLIAAAVHSGHLFARQFGAHDTRERLFIKREDQGQSGKSSLG